MPPAQQREDALFLGPGGTGKSHLAQAIGQAAIQQGSRVLYRETHVLLDDLSEAVVDGTRKQFMETLTTVPLLIIDDFGMRKLQTPTPNKPPRPPFSFPLPVPPIL